MFDSPALEVGIGIVFVFVVFALLCSGLGELSAVLTHRRERFLQQGIRNLLGPEGDDGGRTDRLYAHPLIRELVRPPALTLPMLGKSRNSGLPSNIPAKVFSAALLDVLVVEASTAGTKGDNTVRTSLATLPLGHPLREPLHEIASAPRDGLEEARRHGERHRPAIEAWFDGAMDRVVDWYTLRTRGVLLFCAAIVAIGLNIDTFAVAGSLWRDKALREAVVAAAEQRAQDDSLDGDIADTASEVRGLEQLSLPIGWKFAAPEVVTSPSDPRQWPGTDWDRYPAKAAGIAITTLALALGAPFWFDILKKLLRARKPVQDAPPATQVYVAPHAPEPAPAATATNGETTPIEIDDEIGEELNKPNGRTRKRTTSTTKGS